MKKKVLMGALALSATAVLGLTGCGGQGNDDPKKYTVTFDSNPAISTDDQVVEYEKGATQLEQIPTPVEKEGFAGVWESFTLEDKDITVQAKYGDGTEQNPYLVANANQFKTILENYTYASADNIPATVPHFKLLANIDLNIVDWNAVEYGGSYFAGVIDGNNYGIHNLEGSKFIANEGAVFANIYNATFKNLNIYLGNYIGTLAGNAKGGNNTFENVKVYNSTGSNATTVTADDNNESAFLNWVTGTDTVVNFTNCENHANYTIYASNNGLFVGGYAKENTTVNFSGCINDGNIVSRGVVGMFFGNDSYSPTFSVTNCQFAGTVKSIEGSHILCANSGAVTTAYDDLAIYDGNVDGKITIVGENPLSGLDTRYSATISGDDITIAIKAGEQDTNLAIGQYKLVLSSYGRTNNGSTILTNIIINKTVDDTDTSSLVFGDVLYGMMDLETYNATKDAANKITSSYAQDYSDDGIEWQILAGYNIKYALIDGVYVIDYTQYNVDMGYTSTTINTTVEKLTKTIAVTNGNSLEFIVDFS